MEFRLSIIIPVYNTELYLRRCLDSVITQSLEEIEIIIVNDGSPDNSSIIIKEYEKKDNRIKVINKKNGGLSSARNEGIKIANGEYVLHIDSDDWVEENYFSDMYNFAKLNNLDIVVSDFIEDDNKKYIKKHRDLNIESNVIIDNKDYLKRFFYGEIYPSNSNKLFKIELYRDNKIYYPKNISQGEDLATTPRLAEKALRIGKINKAYYHYIQNPESITKSNPTKRIYELIEALEMIENLIKDTNRIKIIKIYYLSFLVFDLNYNINDTFYRKALEYYLKLIEEVELVDDGVSLGKKVKILKKNPRLKTLKKLHFIMKIYIRVKKIIRKIKNE